MGRKPKRKWGTAEEALEAARAEQPAKKLKQGADTNGQAALKKDETKSTPKKSKHRKSDEGKQQEARETPRQEGEKKGKPPKKKAGEHRGKELVPARAKSEKELQTQLKDLNGVLNSGAGVRSRAVGGKFLAIDPVFSKDEEYLILATRRSVELYLLEDSLPACKFVVPPEYGSVTAIALSTIDATSVYIGTSALKVLLWDWNSERVMSIWKTERAAKHIAVLPGAADDEETVLAVFQTRAETSTPLIVAKNMKSGQGFVDEPWTIFETTMEITGFRALGAELLVAVSTTTMAIGELKTPDRGTPLKYLWRVVEVNEKIASFDAKAHDVDTRLQLNLVLGGADGIIYSYENILRKLKKVEASADRSNLAPRLLHWHRGAVSAVKYSDDGKYLVSGGKESSLVLWQLDTGSKQILPHLLADIDSVTISPSGQFYAVTLADNSVMVLSTAELSPTASIASVQSRICQPSTLLEVIRDDSKEKPHPRYFESRTPAVVDPAFPTRVHLAVPLSQWRLDGEAEKTASFLQTFDFSDSRHMRKQALSRNNTTNPNVNPDMESLKEPNVKHLQVTHDGKWMVTVEEWFPSAEELKYLGVLGEGVRAEQEIRGEIHLKFWSWDKTDNQWTLITRIDAPHASNNERICGRVLDLVAHPRRNAVATVGDDGIVRTWVPKTRFRNGTAARDNANETLVTWTCASTTELERELMLLDGTDATVAEAPITAHLAYATDGSVLAATQEFDEPELRATVHFIDANTGTIRHSESGLYDYGLVNMAFCGRHLVILSGSIVVWDVVSNELVWKESVVNGDLLAPVRAASLSHLAASSSGEKFAVAYPVLKSASADAFQTKIEVFEPSKRKPIISESIPAVVSAIAPLVASDGFLVLDGYAVLSTIGETMSMIPVDATSRQVARKSKAQDALIPVEEVEAAEVEDDDMAIDKPVGDERPVVRKEQLAKALDGGVSRALPLVKDMFQSFMRLYMRKPTTAA